MMQKQRVNNIYDGKPRLTWRMFWNTGYGLKRQKGQKLWLVLLKDDSAQDAAFVTEVICAYAVMLGKIQEHRFEVDWTYAKEQGDIDLLDDDTFILWDETGNCDDIAVIKSYELEVFASEIRNKSRIVPHFENILVEGERTEKISNIVKVHLFEKLQKWAVKPDAQDYEPLRPSSDCLREIVEGTTFGKRTLFFDDTFNGYNSFRWDSNIEYYEHAAIELVLSGYVKVDDEIIEMAKLSKEIEDVINMWDRTFEAWGVPFVLIVNEDAQDFEDIDKYEKRTRVRADGIQTIGRALGVDSMVDAYFSGVPMEDIFA